VRCRRQSDAFQRGNRYDAVRARCCGFVRRWAVSAAVGGPECMARVDAAAYRWRALHLQLHSSALSIDLD